MELPDRLYDPQYRNDAELPDRLYDPQYRNDAELPDRVERSSVSQAELPDCSHNPLLHSSTDLFSKLDLLDKKLDSIMEKMKIYEDNQKHLDELVVEVRTSLKVPPNWNDIATTIDKCQKSCQNMDSHISFVENTYTTLRAPLDYMRQAINSLTGEESKQLPLLEH